MFRSDVLARSAVPRLHFHVCHELIGNPSDLLVMKNEIIHKHHRFHIIHTRVQSDNDGVFRKDRADEKDTIETIKAELFVLGGDIDGEDLREVHTPAPRTY